MSKTLDNIRKLLLGSELYSKCLSNGLSSQELSERLEMLQHRNCLTSCNLNDLIKVCRLNTSPSQRCKSSIKKEEKNDEPCSNYFENQKQQDCAICLEKLDQGEVSYVGKCGHLFHKTCIEDFIKSGINKNVTNGQPQCPICRGPVFKKFLTKKRQHSDEPIETISRERPVFPTLEELDRQRRERERMFDWDEFDIP